MAQKIEIGDRARVLYATFVRTEESVGKVLEVKRVGQYSILLSDGLGHRPEALERVHLLFPEIAEETQARKLQKGDWVRVIGPALNGSVAERGVCFEITQHDHDRWYSCPGMNCYPPESLEKVEGPITAETNISGNITVTYEMPKKPCSATILTRKCLVGGVRCREILGLEGVLGKEELPEEYIQGDLNFVLETNTHNHIRAFDGQRMVDGTAMAKKGHLDLTIPGRDFSNNILEDLLFVGDIIPETTFQPLLTWLKRAGSRLAKIRAKAKAKPTCPNCGEPRSFAIWEDSEGRIICRKHCAEAREWSGEERIEI